MKDKYLSYRPIKRFEKLPLVEDGDIFRPEPAMVDEYFKLMEDENYTNFEEIRNQLLTLQFTPEQVEDAITNGEIIPTYEEWKKEFEIYCLNQRFESELNEVMEQRNTKTTRTVLNKRNPFADVAIQNQSFLYPSKKGYEVLSFTTNKHFIHKETEDGDLYAVVPGFKVSKQKSRENVNTIIATDSVSTLLPETKENKRIVYI